jgi:methionyl aminopeptidase
LAEVLEVLVPAVRPGVTTQALDDLARETMVRRGGRPAFQGYRGYPSSICTSVNDEVVHGIPSRRRLSEGDIVGIDAGVVLEGYYADSAVTVAVGEVRPKVLELIRATEEALADGIAQARPGRHLSDISHAIQKKAESRGFSVVRDFVGHGIGSQLHEAPQIPNYGPPGKGPLLKAGMCLAIEPMVNAGRWPVKVLEDGWTAVTQDGSWSAHFEHTVAVTESDPEILTEWPKKNPSK